METVLRNKLLLGFVAEAGRALESHGLTAIHDAAGDKDRELLSPFELIAGDLDPEKITEDLLLRLHPAYIEYVANIGGLLSLTKSSDIDDGVFFNTSFGTALSKMLEVPDVEAVIKFNSPVSEDAVELNPKSSGSASFAFAANSALEAAQMLRMNDPDKDDFLVDDWDAVPTYMAQTIKIPDEELKKEIIGKFGNYADFAWRTEHHGGIQDPEGVMYIFTDESKKMIIHVQCPGAPFTMWENISKHFETIKPGMVLESHYGDRKYFYKNGTIFKKQKIVIE